jgi:LuxR family transcriptional regulator, quorum-sensing system regulator SolR
LSQRPDLTAYILETMECRTVERLSELTTRVIEPLGLDRFVCAAVLPIDTDPLPETRAIGTMPEAWQREYAVMKYWTVDPVMRQVIASQEPVHWAPLMKEATDAERVVFERARFFGAVDGVTVGVVGVKGLRSVVTFAARTPLNPTLGDRALLRHIAIAVHHRWSAIVPSEGELEAARRLDISTREMECLILLREGKTNPQIAEALRITPRTVQFHLGNIAEKLGARGRTDIVARALALGVVESFG